MDLDNIQFRAIDSGLGFHPSPAPPKKEIPIFVPKRVVVEKPKESNVREFVILKKFTKSTFAFVLDHVFIFILFGLLCIIAYWQCGIDTIGAWKTSFKNDPVFILHLLLFLVLYSFYFLFFRQFKSPSLGEWLIEQ